MGSPRERSRVSEVRDSFNRAYLASRCGPEMMGAGPYRSRPDHRVVVGSWLRQTGETNQSLDPRQTNPHPINQTNQRCYITGLRHHLHGSPRPRSSTNFSPTNQPTRSQRGERGAKRQETTMTLRAQTGQEGPRPRVDSPVSEGLGFRV